MRRRFRIKRKENAIGGEVEGDRNEVGTEGQGLGNAVDTGVKDEGMKSTLRVKDSASIGRILFPLICG